MTTFPFAALLYALGASSALASGPEELTLVGRVKGGDGAAHLILGEVGHATLYYTTPEAMFVATPGVAESERTQVSANLSTATDGTFRIEGLRPGEYGVVAADSAGGIAFASFVLDREHAALQLELAPAGRVAANVRGAPFDAARHVLTLTAAKGTGNIQWTPHVAQVDGGWGFVSSPLPPGRDWDIVGAEVVFAQDYNATLFRQRCTTRAGATSSVDVELASGLQLRGRVTSRDGQPLSGVSVLAWNAEAARGAVTENDGTYSIHGLTAGPWFVDAARWVLRETPGCGNGAQDVWSSRSVELAADAAPTTLDFAVERLRGAPQVGELAPDFTAPLLGDGELRLSSLRGKVVVLDFWATWCGMCRADMPRMTRMYDELAREGEFEMVGVSVDLDPALVPPFLASRKARWPQLEPQDATHNPIAQLYNVHSTPSTVLIDRRGKVVALNLVGDELRRRVEALLATED